MSVQVIMKDGLPEWAVIPYAQYEALLAAAGQKPSTGAALPAPAQEASKPVPAKKPATDFFAGMKPTDTSNAKFDAARFAAIKAELGKSSQAIAKDAGISPAYCEQIERGEREPSPAIIRGLAQALKIKADELLG